MKPSTEKATRAYAEHILADPNKAHLRLGQWAWNYLPGLPDPKPERLFFCTNTEAIQILDEILP